MMAWGSRAFVSWAGISAVVAGFMGFTLMKRNPPAPPIVFESAKIVTSEPAPSGPGDKTKPADTEVVVHVAGAVKHPGVVHLPPDRRAEDAIEKAGGALPQADLDQINLAAKLTDGTQLYIPTRGSAPKPGVAETYQGGISAPRSYSKGPVRQGRTTAKPESGFGSGPKVPTAVVSLNTGSSEQLQTIPGIGPSTADKIIAYRTEHGKFQTVDDLLNVTGIGPKRLDKMRQWLKP